MPEPKSKTFHGHCGHTFTSPTYRAWADAKNRCSNPNGKWFPEYGGRGITMCARWQTFPSFLADMGVRPNGLTLDRIDNDKGYEPGNCRWATAKVQMRNTRHNHYLTLDSETLCVAEWAERRGISVNTIHARLGMGWPLNRVLNEPVSVYRRPGYIGPEHIARIHELSSQGLSQKKIGIMVGLGQSTVGNILIREGITKGPKR